MDEMDKLKRQMSRFMNVGKRNLKLPDEFGGGVQTSPRELVKPIKPKKTSEGGNMDKKQPMKGKKIADSGDGGTVFNPKKVMNMSRDKFRAMQRKHGVEPV